MKETPPSSKRTNLLTWRRARKMKKIQNMPPKQGQINSEESGN